MTTIKNSLQHLIEITENSSPSKILQNLKSDSKLIEELVAIEQLCNVKRVGTTFSDSFWESLQEKQLIALIKAYTITDGNIEKLSYGPLTPVNSLFAALRQNKYALYDLLVDWVIKNRSNLYQIPDDFTLKEEASSLIQYKLLIEVNEIQKQITKLNNQALHFKKKIINHAKYTVNLRLAIARKNLSEIERWINRGADINFVCEDGESLSTKISNLKVEQYLKPNRTLRWRNKSAEFTLVDSEQNTLRISVITELPKYECIFDCVTVSANYERARIIKRLIDGECEKSGDELKNYCDITQTEKKPKLLAASAASKTRFILTPVVKVNDVAQIQTCSLIMEDIFLITQSKEINAETILMAQFSSINSYRFNHYEGILEAILKLSTQSFKNLKSLTFHVNNSLAVSFCRQINYKLYNKVKFFNDSNFFY